jgi:Flp pilus assembly protein TadD
MGAGNLSCARFVKLVIVRWLLIALFLGGMFAVPTPLVGSQAENSRSASPAATVNPKLRSLLSQGVQAMRQGDNASAETSFRQALAIDAKSLDALNNLAIVLSRSGRPAEAVPFYKKALSIRPDPATKRNLAIAYFKSEKYADAWRTLRPMAAAPSADFQVLDLAGFSLVALDRYQEAAQYLERANKKQPTDLETLDMLGKAYLHEKNYKALTSVFARIMQTNPNSASAHIMMGTAYDQMDQRNDAIEEYQLAEKADPNFVGVHSGLGYLYFRQGDMDSAEKEFRAELQRFPDDPSSNCYLGEILLNKASPADAEPLFRVALKANPRYVEALLGLGRTEVGLKRADAAIEPLQRAVEIDPDNFQAHYVLGSAFRQLGRTEEAAKEQKISLAIQEKQRLAAIKKNQSQ